MYLITGLCETHSRKALKKCCMACMDTNSPAACCCCCLWRGDGDFPLSPSLCCSSRHGQRAVIKLCLHLSLSLISWRAASAAGCPRFTDHLPPPNLCRGCFLSTVGHDWHLLAGEMVVQGGGVQGGPIWWFEMWDFENTLFHKLHGVDWMWPCDKLQQRKFI